MIRTQEWIPDLKSVGPDILEDWIKQSRAGDPISRNKMLAWVHYSALDYFQSKVLVESLLTTADAWDMAGDSVVEFERCWFRVRRVSHYCRRMFKNNLNRFLTRKRRLLNREQELDLSIIERGKIASVVTMPKFEFERLSDDDTSRVAMARAELALADESVRSLFEYRVFAGCLTYAEIGEILGTSETCLRMRMNRFNRRVRNRHLQFKQTWRPDSGRRPAPRMEPRGFSVP